MRGQRPPTWLVGLVTWGTLLLGAGCTATTPSPPTGVDGLTIPTPDPVVEEFVVTVDNPWLGLEAGTWSFEVVDGDLDYQVVVTVEPGPSIQGVPTTAVHREPKVGEKQRPTLVASTDYFAQDLAGNVWWFGREGEWLAGHAGAEAGLAMPAEPRRGDGFAMARAAGIDVRAEVTAYDEAAGVLHLELHSGDSVRAEEYTRGIGLVSWELEAADITASRVAPDRDG